jgi:hypothetical protein
MAPFLCATCPTAHRETSCSRSPLLGSPSSPRPSASQSPPLLLLQQPHPRLRRLQRLPPLQPLLRWARAGSSTSIASMLWSELSTSPAHPRPQRQWAVAMAVLLLAVAPVAPPATRARLSMACVADMCTARRAWRRASVPFSSRSALVRRSAAQVTRSYSPGCSRCGSRRADSSSSNREWRPTAPPLRRLRRLRQTGLRGIPQSEKSRPW